MLRQIDEQQFQAITENRGHHEIPARLQSSPTYQEGPRRLRIAEIAENGPCILAKAISFTTASPARLRWPHPILASLQARTENPQLLHLVYERGAFQAELGGSSLGPTNHPPHALKGL